MNTQADITLESFLSSYIATALWSSLDDDCRPLDDKFSRSDIAPKTLDKMRSDCAAFLEANRDTIYSTDNTSDQAAHDFWLTRNRHGAGFWDGDWPEPQATILTDAAHAFGNADLYVGDDGKIYA